MTIRIGTAGWSIPKPCASRFPTTGSALERYSQCFDIVEINSSFHRPHRRTTYERWAASTPDTFGFSVKLPKTITHERRLRDISDPLARFLEEASGLGDKLNTILVQLPPKLEYSAELITEFLDQLRLTYQGRVACEPRHPSWFGGEVTVMLREARVDLVAADPPPCREAPTCDVAPNPAYFRLHGAPRIYFSDYSTEFLERLAQQLATSPTGVAATCIFDNTAAGMAMENALTLKRLMSASAVA